jgi:MFS family permease
VSTRVTVIILHLTTAWAAAYLGYSLALHRLCNGTERAIVDGALPSPSKDRARDDTSKIALGLAYMTVFWTAFVTSIFRVAIPIGEEDPADELHIVGILSWTGLMPVGISVFVVAGLLMDQVLMKEPIGREHPISKKKKKEPIPWLIVGLIPWLILSLALLFLGSLIFAQLQWLLMITLLAFLGYNLAVYMSYVHTFEAQPATTNIIKKTSYPEDIIQFLRQLNSGRACTCTWRNFGI